MVFPLMQERKASAFTLDTEFHQYEALGITAYLVTLLFQLSPGTNWTTPISITPATCSSPVRTWKKAQEGFPRHHLFSRGNTSPRRRT